MGLRIFIFIFLWIALYKVGTCQNAPGFYYITLKDKVGTPYSLQFPQAFLSPKAIEKRLKRGIQITERDLPINPSYLESLVSATNGKVHHQSKWFNSVTLSFTDLDSLQVQQALDTMGQLPFVLDVKCVALEHHDGHVVDKWKGWEKSLHEPNAIPYGVSSHQLDMINTLRLHENGWKGEGVDIAQLDAGWIGLETNPAFERLRSQGQIKMVRDFIDPYEPNIFEGSYHGTFVLGHMAGFVQDSLIGSAPNANFYLMQTENAASEYRIEEDNWVAAIELCDSLGIDIVNSSLGYSLFDDSTMNYTPADMNGDVSRASIAADIAASKGMLIVNSAGNSGNSDWHYITAPSDADSILCIGAVDYDGVHASFSSYGLENTSSVKPNVAAMGKSTYFPGPNGIMAQGSGTSFSSPIIAGSVACLWQAFPEKTNLEIKSAVEQSASLFPHHNNQLGFGIPDFWKAYMLLNKSTVLPNRLIEMVFPNPVNDVLHVKTTGSPILAYRIVALNGQVIERVEWSEPWKGNYLDISVDSLLVGEYLLELVTQEGTLCTPFQKF